MGGYAHKEIVIKAFTVFIILTFILTGCVNIAISPEVTGSVTDVSGNPIEAKVTITHGQLSEHSKSTMTDNNGKYLMSELRLWTAIPFSAVRLNSIIKIEAEEYKTFTYQTDTVDDLPQTIVLYNK